MTQFPVPIKFGSQFLPCANLGSTHPPTKCWEVGTFIHTSPHTHCHRAFYTTGTSGDTCMYSCCRSGSHPPARMYFFELPFHIRLLIFFFFLESSFGFSQNHEEREHHELRTINFLSWPISIWQELHWSHPVALCFCSSPVYCENRGFCWCEGNRVCGGNSGVAMEVAQRALFTGAVSFSVINDSQVRCWKSPSNSMWPSLWPYPAPFSHSFADDVHARLHHMAFGVSCPQDWWWKFGWWNLVLEKDM